jgi:hypothetical protein
MQEQSYAMNTHRSKGPGFNWEADIISLAEWSVTISWFLMYGKSKAIPVTGHEDPYGCEILRLHIS